MSEGKKEKSCRLSVKKAKNSLAKNCLAKNCLAETPGVDRRGLSDAALRRRWTKSALPGRVCPLLHDASCNTPPNPTGR